MAALGPPPTPYADVNAALALLLSGVREVLGTGFVGMYLYGSLASGDFDPERSDVDVLVVTAGELAAASLPALTAMHDGFASSGLLWATRIEGAYLPRPVLRRHDPAKTLHPVIDAGRLLDTGPHGSDWIIERHILREHGVVLAGPHLRTLIDPVQPEDLRAAVLAVLREKWTPRLHDPAWMSRRSYQAYAILTMCRALYTLEHGTVPSKPAAGRWALEALGEPWASMIQRALVWRHDEALEPVNETLEFIRYTLERSLQYAIPEAG